MVGESRENLSSPACGEGAMCSGRGVGTTHRFLPVPMWARTQNIILVQVLSPNLGGQHPTEIPTCFLLGTSNAKARFSVPMVVAWRHAKTNPGHASDVQDVSVRAPPALGGLSVFRLGTDLTHRPSVAVRRMRPCALEEQAASTERAPANVLFFRSPRKSGLSVSRGGKDTLEQRAWSPIPIPGR